MIRILTGKICNIQPFSIHDGPGIRTVIFMKGCNLRCFWCHNPESQDSKKTVAFYPHKCIGCGECVNICPNGKEGVTARFTENCSLCGKCAEECFSEAIEIIGEEFSVDKIMHTIIKDKNLFITSGGGITFSGGEPLLQPDFVAEAMKRCKAEGIQTAIESAVCVPWENIEKILPYCDYFICDLKSVDTDKHKNATGAGNEKIIENLKRLSQTGKLKEVKTPIIPHFNDTKEEIIKIRDIIRSLDGDVKHTLLPFHNICESKYASQGRVFKAAGLEEPSKEKMEELNSVL